MTDEDEFMSEESYEFEFEEDEGDELSEKEIEEQYSMENKYYSAKYCKSDDPKKAINEFKDLLKSPQDEDNIDWIFRSCKQLIKVYLSMGNIEQAIVYVKELTKFIPLVNQNYAEDSVSKILHHSSTIGEPYVSKVYQIISNYLNESSGQHSGPSGSRLRLWLKLNTHQLNLLADEKNWTECEKLTLEITEKLQNASDSLKNTYMFEVIAAEIQITLHKSPINLTQLNQLYKKSLGITSPVTHPKFMGIVHECGAKVQFYRGNYEKARLELYESFKNYDEAGLASKNKILKYLALCLLLTENQFDPFESQETQSYTLLEEFSKLLKLIQSYNESNLIKFQAMMDEMSISNDPLVKDDIFIHSSEIILTHLRIKILERLIKSYRNVKLDYLATALEISKDDLESLILQSISNGKLPRNMKIDFVSDTIQLEGSDSMAQDIMSYNITQKSVQDNMVCIYYSQWHCAKEHEMEITYNSNATTNENVQNPSTSGVSYTEELGHNHHNSLLGPSLDKVPFLPFTKQAKNNNMPRSILRKYIFMTDESGGEKPKEIEQWIRILKSGIPQEVVKELSQKDQVIEEQRADTEENGKDVNWVDHQEEDSQITHNNFKGGSTKILSDWSNLIRELMEKDFGM